MEIPVLVDDVWSWLLIGSVALNLMVALVFFLPLAVHKPLTVDDESDSELPGLSVIVVARNELENLEALVPKILEQDYPNFELIVINDRSYDGTHDWLFELEKKEPKLSFQSLNDDELHLKPGKKFGLFPRY